jgi:hypothetical protein
MNDLINDVAGECPGAPNPVIRKAIIDASRKLCEEAALIRQTITPTYTSGVYTVAIPTGYLIDSIISPIVHGAKIITAIEQHRLDRRVRKDLVGDPVFFVNLTSNTFKLVPDADIDIDVVVSLKPKMDIVTLDADFSNRWFDEITSGAKQNLMMMPSVPWANPDLGIYYKGRFEFGIQKAVQWADGFRNAKPDGLGHVKAYVS